MATRLLKQPVPFHVIFKDEAFILIDIRELFEYEDNKKTDRLAGYKYEVVDTVSFDKITVKIKDQKNPLMPPERLAALRDNGERVIVEFINGFDRLYNRNFNGKWSVEDSFSADDVRLVDTAE